MVILADVYYPGWELTIDGKPAPIYPVNRLMRGAAVTAGTHRARLFVQAPIRCGSAWRYRSSDWAALAVLGIGFSLRPTDPVLSAEGTAVASDHDPTI